MSDLLPPPNAVELWDCCEKLSRSHALGIEVLAMCGYEYIGSYSNGGEYYAPIAGREPVCIVEDSADSITIQSPSSFRVLEIRPGNDPDIMRAFLDTECAYFPVELEAT